MSTANEKYDAFKHTEAFLMRLANGKKRPSLLDIRNEAKCLLRHYGFSSADLHDAMTWRQYLDNANPHETWCDRMIETGPCNCKEK